MAYPHKFKTRTHAIAKSIVTAVILFFICFSAVALSGCGDGVTMYPSDDGQQFDNPVDVFIFMGQSNMGGRGEAAEAIPCAPDHGYEYRAVTGNDEDGYLYSVVEPFGVMEDNAQLSDSGKKSGGMVSSFCEAYYEATGVPVVGVSASVGGTSIKLWTPGTDYFAESVRRLNSCVEYLLSETDFQVRHVNMVWCQGCSDATSSANGSIDYVSELKSIVDAMQEGEHPIEKCFVVTISEYSSGEYVPNKAALADLQIELCEEDEDFVLASKKFRGVPDYLRDDPHFHQGVYNVAGWDAGTRAAEYVEFGETSACEDFIPGEEVELAEMFGIKLTYYTGME